MAMESQLKGNGDKKCRRKGKKSKFPNEDFPCNDVVSNVAPTHNSEGEHILKKKSKKKKKSKECDEDATEISLLLNTILAPYLNEEKGIARKKSKKKKAQGNEVNLKGADTGERLVERKAKKRKKSSNQRDGGRAGGNKESTSPTNGGIWKEKSKKRKAMSERVEISGSVIHSDPANGKSAKKKSEKKRSKGVENSSSHKERQDSSAAGPEHDSCASTSKSSAASGKTVPKYQPAEEVLNTDDFTEEQRKANEYVLSGKYLPTITECLNNDFGEGRRPYVPLLRGDPICPYCHKLFVQSSWRDHHVRSVHLKIKKLKCNWCGQRFSERETLKGHEYMHMEAKTFPCKYCNKVYRYSSHMWRHMRSHMRDLYKVLDGLESDRRKRKNSKELDTVEKKKKVEESSEECPDDENDLVGRLINTQSEVFNDIKDSFCVDGNKKKGPSLCCDQKRCL